MKAVFRRHHEVGARIVEGDVRIGAADAQIARHGIVNISHVQIFRIAF